MKFSIHEFLKVGAFSICQNLSDTTASGVAVDTRGFSELLALLTTGILGGTAPTLAVTLESGAASDGSGSVAITGAAFTTVTTSNDPLHEWGRVDLLNNTLGRYIKPVCTVGGTTPTGEYAVIFLLIKNSGELPAQAGSAAKFNV